MADGILVYGESGTFKSTTAGVFADYIVERYNTMNERDDGYVRLVTADSGWGPMADQVKRGVIKPWSLKAIPRESTLAFVRAASEGYWPCEINNGIANLVGTDTMYAPEFDGCAGYIWEGLTEVAALLMEHLQTTIKNPAAIKVNQTGQFVQSIPGTKISYEFSGSTEASYLTVQNITQRYVKRLTGLPVDRVLVTSHEGKGTDNKTKRLVFGPMIVGKALTDLVSGWFGMTFHHDSYMYNKVVRIDEGKKTAHDVTVTKPGVRAYFERHPDCDAPNIFWPAKLECTPRKSALIEELWPEGFVPLVRDGKGNYVSGLHTLLKEIDKEDE